MTVLSRLATLVLLGPSWSQEVQEGSASTPTISFSTAITHRQTKNKGSTYRGGRDFHLFSFPRTFRGELIHLVAIIWASLSFSTSFLFGLEIEWGISTSSNPSIVVCLLPWLTFREWEMQQFSMTVCNKHSSRCEQGGLLLGVCLACSSYRSGCVSVCKGGSRG